MRNESVATHTEAGVLLGFPERGGVPMKENLACMSVCVCAKICYSNARHAGSFPYLFGVRRVL